MAWIPGGTFSMGCLDPRGIPYGGDKPMTDARPIHAVTIDGFWIDTTEVTNEQFNEFGEASEYVTVAEIPPRPEDFPGAPPENLVAGSIVFTPPDRPVPLSNHLQWWAYVPGANWRHPLGPKSTIEGKENLPVVHVAFEAALTNPSDKHTILYHIHNPSVPAKLNFLRYRPGTRFIMMVRDTMMIIKNIVNQS
mgnify:CR=1 FL=1